MKRSYECDLSAFWEAVASDYDVVADQFPARYARAVDLVCAVGSAATRNGGVFIDLGCGTGRALARVVSASPSSRGVGVDASAGMLRLAKERLSQQETSHAALLLQYDVASPGLVDAVTRHLRSFCRVPRVVAVAVAFVGHDLSPSKRTMLLKSAARLLDTEGVLVVADLFSPDGEGETRLAALRELDEVSRCLDATDSGRLSAAASIWTDHYRTHSFDWTVDSVMGLLRQQGLEQTRKIFFAGQVGVVTAARR
ncbi:MAG TPA: methyltransferase domain-containing protein [Candidatus Limnocylindrales bacterium]|nr:methyltransferase domain-containing protein [Candidatus Limnocylindrales bacterium]